MEDYATSQVAYRLPHLWYLIIYTLEASLVHRRHPIQREAFQIDLRGLDRLVSQQFADHLDRYTLFLQGRSERVTDRIRGNYFRHTTGICQLLQGPVKISQGRGIFPEGLFTRFRPARFFQTFTKNSYYRFRCQWISKRRTTYKSREICWRWTINHKGSFCRRINGNRSLPAGAG